MESKLGVANAGGGMPGGKTGNPCCRREAEMVFSAIGLKISVSGTLLSIVSSSFELTLSDDGPSRNPGTNLDHPIPPEYRLFFNLETIWKC